MLKDFPIGHVFEHDKVRLKVVLEVTCNGCYYNGCDCSDLPILCSPVNRKDRKPIIIVETTEPLTE